MNKVGEIRLVDFSLSSKEVKGFAKMIGGGKLKTIQGTRTYIAPETIRKEAPTFQTDLYSLGIMFFEVLTGKTPFQAPTPEELLQKHLRAEPPNASEFNPNVSPEMDRLIARLLKKKPADRHSSVDEVLGELKRIKIFKEDVTEESIAKANSEKSDTMDQLTDVRLDSRADAKLSEMLQASPELAQKFAVEKQAKAAKKQADANSMKERVLKATSQGKPAKPAAPPPTPVPQPMPPAYSPGFGQYPPMPMGNMPPMQGPPGMMPPGMPAYPNMGFPPQPQFAPPMAQPPMPMPPGMPVAPMPVRPSAVPPGATTVPPMPGVARGPAPSGPSAAVPPAQQHRPLPPAPVPAQPVPPKSSSAPANPASASAAPDDLDYMTELPDVL